MRTLFLGLALMSGPAQADSLAAPEGMDPSCQGHEANRETYLKELELVVNGGQMDLVDNLIASDYVNHAAPPGAAQGPSAIRQYLALLKTAFPDRKVRNDMLFCAGDTVEELEKRLKAGDANLLSVLLSVPAAYGAYQAMQADQSQAAAPQ